MFEKQSDHFKIINDSLTGSSPLDEETFSSVAVLAERLEKLKRNSDHFKDITFSPQLEELAQCEMISAIC
jgi:hypothetical protein